MINGTFREGLILKTKTGFGDIAPLPGFSRESLAEATAEATRLLPDFPHAKPQLPSVQFAFACAQIPLTSTKVAVNALNIYRPGFTAVKIKVLLSKCVLLGLKAFLESTVRILAA